MTRPFILKQHEYTKQADLGNYSPLFLGTDFGGMAGFMLGKSSRSRSTAVYTEGKSQSVKSTEPVIGQVLYDSKT